MGVVLECIVVAVKRIFHGMKVKLDQNNPDFVTDLHTRLGSYATSAFINIYANGASPIHKLPMSAVIKQFLKVDPITEEKMKLGTKDTDSENIPIVFDSDEVHLDSSQFLKSFMEYIAVTKKTR